MAQKNGTGMFPREVMNRLPLLRLEEEGRLNDMPLGESSGVMGTRGKHVNVLQHVMDEALGRALPGMAFDQAFSKEAIAWRLCAI